MLSIGFLSFPLCGLFSWCFLVFAGGKFLGFSTFSHGSVFYFLFSGVPGVGGSVRVSLDDEARQSYFLILKATLSIL